MAPVEVIIYEGEDKYYVYRDAEGRSELTPINIGDIGEYYVEIIGGIKEGDVLYYPEREISLRTYLENE